MGHRFGKRIGRTFGKAIGIGVDELGGGATNPMATVARDAASGIYCPANAAQWTTTLGVAGIATGNPTSLYLCQEAGGNLADSIGTNTLTLAGAGHLFQQAVAGWTRLAATTIDGTAGQKWLNSTTSPSAPATSVLVLGYIRMPAAAPAAARDVYMVSNNADLRFNTTAKLRPTFGATADLVNVSTGATRPVVMKVNNTATIEAIYTEQEKFLGTYALPATATFFSLGGQATLAGDFGYLYVAEFAGAAAELSDAQVKTLLQTLGWTIPWT